MAKSKSDKNNGATLGLEQTLWLAADKLRKNIDAAEYKHIALGLIFLKYISDSFESLHNKLIEGKGDYKGADPEDADEYRAENVFFVPQTARWSYLHSRAKLPSIGKDVDNAMEAIEKENPTLKGILPKVFARPNLDKAALGGLIDLIGNIALGDESAKSKDLLGKVYEYFLGQFANAEGKKGGQFYTPSCVVKLLVEMIQPYKGRVFDPCCGSGGMFVMSEKFVESRQGKINDISIYGQESNQTTYRLCRMNLAIRQIDGSQVKWNNEGSFLNDAHKDLKADFILANPPFNDSDWSGELLAKDARWKYGTPPASNANFAWIQHFIYHLAPNGLSAFVMHCSAASNKGYESEIRKNLIENDVVDCLIHTPTQLFYNTSLPVHLWIVTRNKKASLTKRERTNHVLMIDASRLGFMLDSTHHSLPDEDIRKVAETYHNWINKNGSYKNIEGFCKVVTIEDIKKKNYVLAPNRFVKEKNVFSRVIKTDDLKNDLIPSLQLAELAEIKMAQLKEDAFIHSIEKYIHNIRKYNWDEVEVFQVIKEITGGEWGSEEPKKGYVECKVIRGTDFPNIPLYNLGKIPTRFIKKEKVDDKKASVGDLIVEMSGGSKGQPTGRCVFISNSFLQSYDVPVLYSNFCKRIRVNTELVDPYWFYLYWMTAHSEGLTTKYENQPSGIRNFQLDEFIASELILIPPKDTQIELVKIFNAMYEAEQLANLTSDRLKRIEKKLFYKLLSENYE